MKYSVKLERTFWPLYEPFVISRGSHTEAECLSVTIADEDGHRGRGEGCPVYYDGETIDEMWEQIEKVRPKLEAGVSREELLTLLPHGGARAGVDAALWDLEAKHSGVSAFMRAGITDPKPIRTAYTIGIRSVDGYEKAARERATYPLLKIKVNQDDPVAAIAAAHKGAPNAVFIVDPNQAWSVDTLKRLAPQLAALGVVLLEQPIKVGDEAGLDGYRSPIPVCADELINDIPDLEKARGRFQAINIKLDKAGGLTNALRLASAARATGFELMVGSMLGASLSMAPATVLGQQCAFVDLDGPLLISKDWPDALVYNDGILQVPSPALWG